MRRVLFAIIVAAWALCPFSIQADGEDPPDLVAVVRLYTDWRNDPKAYATVSVPLEGLDVTFDAVAAGSGRSLREDAVVVVVPGDQRDAAVARAMEGCIFGEPCRSGGRFTLRPGLIRQVQLKPCVFLDALRQPIPNAEVEILLAESSLHESIGPKVWLADARLDATGRMQSPRVSAQCRLRHVLFTVIHPDCGPMPAVANFFASESENTLFVSALPKDRWRVFVDALGRPMAGATVEILPSSAWPGGRQSETSESRPSVAQGPVVVLDEAGRLRPNPRDSLFMLCSFLVYDPNYGIGIVEPPGGLPGLKESASLFVVPLTAVGTQADERSIWGTVVDVNDDPVAGAVLRCGMIRTPGGGSLQAWWPWQTGGLRQAKVLTDREGRFAMHLPLADSDGKLGRPVPPGATYEVMIEAPAAQDFQRFHGSLAAGQEHRVVLRPKSWAFSGVLVFHDEFGPVRDPEKLRRVTLSIRTQKPDGRVSGADFEPGGWMEKENLPFGTYTATADWGGKHYQFGPVEVTPESPGVVVLMPANVQVDRKLYRGRVVHGITGEPIPGALVMRRPMSGILDPIDSDLTPRLLQLGPELDPDGELAAFLTSYRDLGVTRTDAAGRFETVLPVGARPMGPPPGLLAIQRSFLGAEQLLRFPVGPIEPGMPPQFHEFEPDATGSILLPDMKLFPAGIVVVEPNVPLQFGLSPEKDVAFSYATAQGDATPWLKDFWASPSARQGGSVFRRQKLPVNELQMVYVPADVTLTLTIRRYDEQSAPVVIKGVHLRQGEVLDLGRMEFPKGLQITARAVDSGGKPVEGVTILSFPERMSYRGRGAVTDGEGFARVYVPPHSQGQLVVEYRDRQTWKPVRESTPYRVGGEEDAGRKFVLRLSDGFLEELFKSR
jgi:hypothetical protein